MDSSTVEVCGLKKGTEDGLLPTTKRDLIKLLIECESEFESGWIFVKDYFKEES